MICFHEALTNRSPHFGTRGEHVLKAGIMATRILLAGATGVIGRRLAPLLVAAGYEVFGTTRSAAKAGTLASAGVETVVLDVFDATAVSAALSDLRPEIVVHQLTDLPTDLLAHYMDEALRRNARIRDEGTRNLVAAAKTAGARHLVAQSISFVYAPGPLPHRESDPLDIEAEGTRLVTVQGVAALETQTLDAAPIVGAVLRYGHLYGPGTGADSVADPVSVHVDAAAHAALLAVEKYASGLFNIAEPNDEVATDKAQRDLGWDPGFRLERT